MDRFDEHLDTPSVEGAARASAADRSADRLERLYAEIRAVSGQLFDRERTGHTLQPTAVAHEAWIRLARHLPTGDANPDLPLIVRVVRNVLVDHARRRLADRRGGPEGRREPLTDELVAVDHDPEAMIVVGDAIESLRLRSERAAQVVELRFIAGCSEDEVALLLGCSRATVARDWRTARMWLRRALAGESPTDGPLEADA